MPVSVAEKKKRSSHNMSPTGYGPRRSVAEKKKRSSHNGELAEAVKFFSVAEKKKRSSHNTFRRGVTLLGV